MSLVKALIQRQNGGKSGEEFLSKKGLTEDAKKNILSSKNKKRQYFYEESKKVSSACLDFQDYITKNAIFLSSDLKSEFKKAEKTIRTAWATRDAWENSQDRNKGIAKACQITQEEIPPIMEEIEEMVQNRLRFFEA